MSGIAAPAGRLIADVEVADLTHAMAGAGLCLDFGAVSVRVRSDATTLAAPLQAVYRSFPFVCASEWADVHVRIDRAKGLRRWLRPQVTLRTEGLEPFDPFPADNALPLLEWGCNWMIGRTCNDLLLLHSGALERDGFALLLPASPGSGKSTLTAALSQRGWRLLSDEFGAYDPEAGLFRAVLKPIALKNRSIPVMRQFAPSATFGPSFPNTRKGTVAHMAALADAVTRRHETALPGAVVLPRWEASSPTRFERLDEHAVFPALAFNAFNYSLLGEVAFKATVQLVRRCPAWQLVYSDLEEALATIETAWLSVLEHHRASPK